MQQSSGNTLSRRSQKLKIRPFRCGNTLCRERCVTIQRRRNNLRTLDIARHPRSRRQSIGPELRGYIGRRDLLIMCRAATAMHRIAGQKLLMRPHPLRLDRPRTSLLRHTAHRQRGNKHARVTSTPFHETTSIPVRESRPSYYLKLRLEASALPPSPLKSRSTRVILQ